MIFSAAPVMTATEDIRTEDSALAAQFMLWAGLTARQNSGAGGKDIFDGDHDQQQRDRDAYRRQGDIRMQHPDIGGIHDVVGSLCQQSQRGWNSQLNNGFGWLHLPQN